MTIGIAAVGPNAGEAVFKALAAVEKVASGSIGGFAAFVAINRTGELVRASTQRGGTSTLFVSGETSGVGPPADFATARFAALMSSGPDRPEPLAQFTPGDKAAGLVTGHRLPNAAGRTGRPVNLEVLQFLRDGLSSQVAVDRVLDADPEADAGLIAIDLTGRVYARNSARVSRRPDLGHARRENGELGAVVEVLNNAISPATSIAMLAADIALLTMAPAGLAVGSIEVASGTPLASGPTHRILLDGDGKVMRIETPDTRLLAGRHNCAAVYLGADVVQGGIVIGTTLVEPNVVVEDGLIVSLSGQPQVSIPFAAPEKER